MPMSYVRTTKLIAFSRLWSLTLRSLGWFQVCREVLVKMYATTDDEFALRWANFLADRCSRLAVSKSQSSSPYQVVSIGMVTSARESICLALLVYVASRLYCSWGSRECRPVAKILKRPDLGRSKHKAYAVPAQRLALPGVVNTDQ